MEGSQLMGFGTVIKGVQIEKRSWSIIHFKILREKGPKKDALKEKSNEVG